MLTYTEYGAILIIKVGAQLSCTDFVAAACLLMCCNASCIPHVKCCSRYHVNFVYHVHSCARQHKATSVTNNNSRTAVKSTDMLHKSAICMWRCALQAFAWCAVFVLSVLIVASRKHYTVDVLIAWYVVPLVFYAMLRRWTTKRPVNEEPWPHRSLAEDNALQLEEVVVHGSMAAPEVGLFSAVKAPHIPLPHARPPPLHHLLPGMCLIDSHRHSFT